MLIAVLLSLGLLLGAPVPALVLAGVAAVFPLPLLVGAGGWAVWSHLRKTNSSVDDEASFLADFGGRIRSGASLRLALVAAADGHPRLPLARASRLSAAGVPIDQVCVELACLPGVGKQFAAAVQMATKSGGLLLPVIGRLIESSQRRAELDRELRIASAQARLSALVVGVAPLLFTGLLVVTGVVPSPWGAGGTLAAISIAGLGLEIVGLAWVWVAVRWSGA